MNQEIKDLSVPSFALDCTFLFKILKSIVIVFTKGGEFRGDLLYI